MTNVSAEEFRSVGWDQYMYIWFGICFMNAYLVL